jgi:ArsR family transcriptional regulator
MKKPFSDTRNNKKLYELKAELCKTLANPKRLEILDILRDGEKQAKTLVDQLGIPKANLSQHLSVLKHKRLVVTRRHGVNIFYKLNDPKMAKACDLIGEVLFGQIEEHKHLLKYR